MEGLLTASKILLWLGQWIVMDLIDMLDLIMCNIIILFEKPTTLSFNGWLIYQLQSSWLDQIGI